MQRTPGGACAVQLGNAASTWWASGVRALVEEKAAAAGSSRFWSEQRGVRRPQKRWPAREEQLSALNRRGTGAGCSVEWVCGVADGAGGTVSCCGPGEQQECSGVADKAGGRREFLPQAGTEAGARREVLHRGRLEAGLERAGNFCADDGWRRRRGGRRRGFLDRGGWRRRRRRRPTGGAVASRVVAGQGRLDSVEGRLFPVRHCSPNRGSTDPEVNRGRLG